MKTVLIVDDEISLCILLRRILEYRGYNTLLAHNGFDALRILSQHSVDLVLLDVMMPGMSGIEVCQNMRDNLATTDIPVIILTASHNPDTRLGAIRAGANLFYHKPFDTDELVLAIQVLLDMPLQMPIPVQSLQLCQ